MPSRSAPSSPSPRSRQPQVPPSSPASPIRQTRPIPSDGQVHYDVSYHFTTLLIDQIRTDLAPDNDKANFIVRYLFLLALEEWLDSVDLKDKSKGFVRLVHKLPAEIKEHLVPTLCTLGEVAPVAGAAAGSGAVVRSARKSTMPNKKVSTAEKPRSKPPGRQQTSYRTAGGSQKRK